MVQLKSKIEWVNVQLILISGLLFLIYGVSFAENVYSTGDWFTPLSQFSALTTTLVLTILLIKMKSFSSSLYSLIWSALLWLSLAGIGITLFPNIAVIALAVFPAIYAGWLFLSKNLLLLNQQPVWGLTLFWLLLICLDSYSATQFYVLPLFNLTDFLSLLMFIGLIWVIYHHHFDDEHSVEWGFKVSTILVGLLVLSSIVVRAMHHYVGTPLWGIEIWRNGNVQLSLTLLWVILAFILMTFSSCHHIRQIWFVGAALLGIVVFKLLLLDLSQSGTLTRVISFIGSGAVMLVIAYLAPLPPAQEQSKESSSI